VLLKRDDNWKKLQQYVLEERETMDVTRSMGAGLRLQARVSVVPAPGLLHQESPDLRRRQDRRGRAPAPGGALAGARAVPREAARGNRRRQAAPDAARSEISIGPGGVNADFEAALRDSLEPGFVSAAYFMDFKFEQGQYAFVGREKYEGHDVLKVEYYPMKMFTGGRGRPNRQLRERNKEIGGR
jgi:hypothetical protein